MSTPLNLQSFKYLIWIQLLVGLMAALLGALLVSLSQGASIATGVGLMMASVLSFAWVSARLFAKKSIAWTSLVIVFKYAVLLAAIFFLMQTSWFSPFGAGLGVASFTLAVLVFAVFEQRKR